jgi:Domain of unknown function (DUF4349)
VTLIEDETLRDVLADAGAGFEVPKQGVERILAAARPREVDPRPAVRRHLPQRRRTKVALGVAAVVILALGVAGPLVSFGREGSRTIPTTGNPVWGVAAGLPAKVASGPAFGGADAIHGPANSTRSPLAVGTGIVPTLVVAVGTVDLATGSSGIPHVLAQLSSEVGKDGGFVEKTTAQLGSAATSSATIVLRVPEGKYELLLAQVQRLGHATAVNTNATDVTAQFVDYQSRIAALELSRQQYLAIMAKAGSIGEILAVQSQINLLQSQIEQLKGQRNVLRNQAAYGTLTVGLSPTGSAASSATAGSGLVGAVHGSVGGFVAAFEGLIRLLGPALFALMCLAAALILGRLVWRATRRRML